ncbi:MAG: DUF3347 domain-containing protein [Chitinophagaceae bacterium]
MKRIFFIVALFATAFTQDSFAQDSTNQSQIPQLLSLYYNIKDALVVGNANTAASKAEAFVKATNGNDYKVISEGNLKALVKDAGKISKTKDLKKQREYFASFSNNMIAIAKAVKLSDKPIYQAYCPMKKTSWLSSEKAIKNPYYGSSMLTCGEVTSTLE